ncbi:MAG TPA: substrate-binding domain-containing protein [Anaeromyxobacteraceae bacterium]|nr:substrate-binding domain-containing protein [Anaeromyxobacteraceae bacterium]
MIIYHAGSLSAALTAVEDSFVCNNPGTQVLDCSGGSVDLARQITAGGLAADIYAPADYLDIERLLKPTGYASYDILIARGKMVLSYTTTSLGTTLDGVSIAGTGTFNPPSSGFVENSTVPDAAANWYSFLTQPGVLLGGSYLYLDPSGYRAPMIFQLAQSFYQIPALYNDLLEHYLATAETPAASGATGRTHTLGTQYDYQITYEHSAEAAYQKSPSTYRYVNLPDDINLGNPDKNGFYQHSVIVEPGLGFPGLDSLVALPASRVVWGATILRDAPNRDNAIKFLQLLLGGTGQTAFEASGPAPFIPAVVSRRDYKNLPLQLQTLVTQGDVFEGE